MGAKMNLFETGFKFFIFFLLLRFVKVIFTWFGQPKLAAMLKQEDQAKADLLQEVHDNKERLQKELQTLEMQQLELADLQKRIDVWRFALKEKQRFYQEELVLLDKKYCAKAEVKVLGYCKFVEATKLANDILAKRSWLAGQISLESSEKYFAKTMQSLEHLP